MLWYELFSLLLWVIDNWLFYVSLLRLSGLITVGHRVFVQFAIALCHYEFGFHGQFLSELVFCG